MRPLLYLSVLSVGACSWTQFDDLGDQTWVDSTKKPDVKSSDWAVGLGIASPADPDNFAGSVAIIGTGTPTYSVLDYGADGKSKLRATVSLLQAGNVESLAAQPVMLTDYATKDSFVVGAASQNQVAYVDIAGQAHQIFGPGDVAASVFVNVAGTRGVIAGNATKLYSQSTMENSCDIGVTVSGLGTVPSATAGDDLVIVFDSTGGLGLYPSTVFSGDASVPPVCTPLGTALATGFAMGTGTSITPIGAESFLLQSHTTSGGTSFLGVFTVDPAANTITAVGNSITAANLKSATVLKTATGTYAVGGYPSTVVDGKTGGQVIAYQIMVDGSGNPTGLTTDPAMMLSDAQPENDESFGRAVATMTFRGEDVLVVGADNEVFAYFQSMLYGETREGK